MITDAENEEFKRVHREREQRKVEQIQRWHFQGQWPELYDLWVSAEREMNETRVESGQRQEQSSLVPPDASTNSKGETK